jgi:hypothetical protein
MLKIDEAAQHIDFLAVSAKKKIPQMGKILKKPQWEHLPGPAEVKSLKRVSYMSQALETFEVIDFEVKESQAGEAFQEGQIGAFRQMNAQPDVGPVRDEPTRLEQLLLRQHPTELHDSDFRF